ncbi:His/Glu/Gln/Arg/opine family amino acid ABC transporter permease subunit [Bradyrhizobium sp. USDA 4354]
MGYTLDFSVVWQAMPALLWGCVGTLGLALAGMTLAMMIGVAGVAARDSRATWLRALVIGFVEVVRNTPFLVQIFFLFFALPLVGLKLNPTATAIIALGVNGGAYAIEIIRGGGAVHS